MDRTRTELSLVNPNGAAMDGSSPELTASMPASPAAPVSPLTRPICANARMPSRARSSSIAMNASIPEQTSGQATIDGVSQFSPAMIDGCGPGTDRMPLCRIEAITQAAEVGSTPMIRGPDVSGCRQ